MFVTGLDLGQTQDPSAIAIVERVEPDDAPPVYDVRHLHRWKLRTPYPAIVADVASMFARGDLAGSTLAIDATGVGRGIVDMFRTSEIRAHLMPVTITGGHEETAESDSWHVPKKNLVSITQALLQTGRLRISPALPEAATLAREMEMFRVKVTLAGNETFEAWRERDHDDLLLATAIALWWAERDSPMPFMIAKTAPAAPAAALPDYAGVEYLRVYDCWVAHVVDIEGRPRAIRDLPTAEDAAHLVNLAARRAGRPQPNYLLSDVDPARAAELERLLLAPPA